MRCSGVNRAPATQSRLKRRPCGRWLAPSLALVSRDLRAQGLDLDCELPLLSPFLDLVDAYAGHRAGGGGWE